MKNFNVIFTTALFLEIFVLEFVSGEFTQSYYEKHSGKAIDGAANSTITSNAIACVLFCKGQNPESVCTHAEYNRSSNLCRFILGGQASLIDVADDNVSVMAMRTPHACGPVTEPEYGGVVYSNGSLVATFFCNQGYVLNGSETLQCIGGTWDGETPICEVTPQIAVFRVAVGCGSPAVEAWLSGENTTTDIACINVDINGCPTHYRDPIVDSWNTLGITQVRYSIYKNDLEVAYVLFNGTGSTISSWFNRTRVLESSYSNITMESGMSCFDIDPGLFGVPDGRHFAIQNSIGSCESMDITYFLTIDHGGCCCPYDELPPYPYIYYSTTGEAQSTGLNATFDQADTAIIYVYT